MSSFCPECGTRNTDDAAFCSNCGKSLGNMNGNTSTRASFQSPQPVTSNRISYQSQSAPQTQYGYQPQNTNEPQYGDLNQYGQYPQTPHAGFRKDPVLGVIITLFIPGFAYLYIGKTAEGIAYTLGVFILYGFTGLAFLVHIFLLFRAMNVVKTFNRSQGFPE